MIMDEIIGRIRYPNEKISSFDSRIPYNEITEDLKNGLKSARGQLKTDMQETLAELERIWGEKQSKAKRIEIPERKAISSM